MGGAGRATGEARRDPMDVQIHFQLGFTMIQTSLISLRFWNFSVIFKLVKSLIHAPFFEPLKIADVAGDLVLTKRLREMGFHSGCEVRIVGRAPFNGPFVVQLHDSVLALRVSEAECLLIR